MIYRNQLQVRLPDEVNAALVRQAKRQKMTRCALARTLIADALSVSVPAPERAQNPPKVCTLPDCDRDHHAKGLCAPHYVLDRRRRDRVESDVPVASTKGLPKLVST